MIALDETHDPSLLSWVESAHDLAGEFPIQNLPFGVFSPPQGGTPRVGVAIGDMVLDLSALPADALPGEVRHPHVATGSLDELLTLGRPVLTAIRRRISALLSIGREGNEVRARREDVLFPQASCRMHLATTVPDYTDFYAGIEHARRAAQIARVGTRLADNYGSQPIGYHGRASTVRVSGTPVRRPTGPRPSPDGTVSAPTEALDFELEMAVVVCGPAGASTIATASERIAGLCLLNDWSARDIQRWEMAPLGPFLGKSFATTVSPWLVTMDALLPFAAPAMMRLPEHGPPLAYLNDEADQRTGGFDIELAVTLASSDMRDAGLAAATMTTSNTRHLYWTVAQLVAHHTVNGCDLRPGDLLGTGTISGPAEAESGSLLELTRNGQDLIRLPTGETRGYLNNGDEVGLLGRCRREGFSSIGFGPCYGLIVA